jgi:hypothetical protein
MSYPSYETIEVSAPLAADIKESDNSVFVKGFASIESPDRDNHFAPASEFNVDTFLNTGTLLRDHKFIKDRYGNDRSAGVVRDAEPAYISGEEAEEYIISSSRSMDEINRLPKSKYPDLTIGDKGLFIVAEVINDLAKQEVISGELGAFSWRGIAHIEKSETEKHDVLRMIDLKEISLVHMPKHTSAAITLGKSDDFDQGEIIPNEIIKFKLAKSFYPNKETVSSFLKARGIEYTSITESESDFFAVVQDQADYDITKSYLVKLGDVSVVTASRLDKDTSTAETVGDTIETQVEDNTVSEKTPVAKSLRLCFVDETVLNKFFPNAVKDIIKSEQVENESGEVVTQEYVQVQISDEDIQALVVTPEAKTEEVAADAEQAEEVTPEVVTAEAPSEEAPAEDPLAKLLARLESLEAKLTAPAPVAVDSEKERESLVEVMKSEIIRELSKSISLPLTSREERVEVTKSADNSPKTDFELFSFMLRN